MKSHTEKSALDSLIKKGVNIKHDILSGRILEIRRNSLGNGSLGKLDYLVKHHNWTSIWK